MPLTDLQRRLVRLLSVNRSADSYLAGGAALHLAPSSSRFSEDLDYFHDSEVRVAEAFSADSELLIKEGFKLDIILRQPGFIRAIASVKDEATKLEWAYDSAWRFFPVSIDPDVGFVLHPIDLAINKLLALVGRDEARDFLDIIECHQQILPLAALIWAASAKDPGFAPGLILEQLKRRGRYREEDFTDLALVKPISLVELKKTWLSILAATESELNILPPEEIGCLYFSSTSNKFGLPSNLDAPIEKHGATLGGVIPKIG